MKGTRAHPPPRQERNLLAAYLEAEVDASLIFRFKALQVLGHFRETMWGVVAEASGTSALSDEEARGYTDENYANFVTCRDGVRGRGGGAARRARDPRRPTSGSIEHAAPWAHAPPVHWW